MHPHDPYQPDPYQPYYPPQYPPPEPEGINWSTVLWVAVPALLVILCCAGCVVSGFAGGFMDGFEEGYSSS
ncbi:hypothetical protein O7598_24155 [Micromonospora sp. WMMC241]|uniref:Uncharacterized protein n=1 Tax=Micromonospora humi TaxID=745366 RepID=A0A1C5IS03_9ACTN|nr:MULTISPECIES: hypothetical protein [Micromonospora]MCZ7439518.1 hypothetical protein [Micromonospora sp. WMMC241]SCG61095.1 hypothetical protein GA0070213_10715 [Micromonospora humi]